MSEGSFFQSLCKVLAQVTEGSRASGQLLEAQAENHRTNNQCTAKNILLNSHLILAHEAEAVFKTNHCVSSAG